ncbi:MAG: APC family permease [Candidatus Acidiferrales bacterium]
MSGDDKLIRGLGLKEATALNMMMMVGIGPFIVVPLMLGAMGGPQAMLGWVCGAVLALCDGLVWAELGAAMPRAGGSYVYLREAYGPERWGRLMSFLFIWTILFQAPLSMSSGMIGFADYLSYLIPAVGTAGPGLGDRTLAHRLVAAGLAAFIVFLLYRKITTIGRMSLVIWAIVVGLMGWIIVGGLTHFDSALAFDVPPGAFALTPAFFTGLGAAMLISIYTYLGYQNVCYLGGEIKNPERVIPRAIILSILAIGALYFLMNLGLIAVIPWREALESKFIVSTFIERLYGHRAAQVATGLILVAAFASVFALTLGYSRVPYAAALDGGFFRFFARLHDSKQFPYVSLLAVGGAGILFSFLFKLGDVIKALIAIRVLVQFVSQVVGLMLLRRARPQAFPFRMWLYPLPALLALVGWFYVFFASGMFFIVLGCSILLAGVGVYLLRARTLREFPFAETT